MWEWKMILDYVDNLEIPDSEIEGQFNARMALARLSEGLFWIYNGVTEFENMLRAKAASDNIITAMSGEMMNDVPIGLISCMFQWYAVSACNYAQLVGWLVTKDPELSKKYVEKVMPKILFFRHKIAAHIAQTNPKKSDNEADLVASVNSHIIFHNRRLCTATIVPVVEKDGSEIDTSCNTNWSLTFRHEELSKRYWPHGSIKSCQDIQIPPGNTKVRLEF